MICLDEFCSRKLFRVLNRTNEHYYRIQEIRISLGINFHLSPKFDTERIEKMLFIVNNPGVPKFFTY